MVFSFLLTLNFIVTVVTHHVNLKMCVMLGSGLPCCCFSGGFFVVRGEVDADLLN